MLVVAFEVAPQPLAGRLAWLDNDVGGLGRALAARFRGERNELMANFAAYSGLRWGELAALTIPQVAEAARVITVDRKVVEVGGRPYVEAPKNRKFRRTIYPRRTPAGYPLAERLAARIEEARTEKDVFPMVPAVTSAATRIDKVELPGTHLHLIRQRSNLSAHDVSARLSYACNH